MLTVLSYQRGLEQSTTPLRNPTLKSVRSIVITSIAALGLSACGSGGSGGSGGSDNSDNNMQPSEPDPIVASTTTESLKSNAADGVGLSLDGTLTGFQRFDDTSEPTAALDSGTREILRSTLGLEQDSAAETVRTEELVTINPDEREVCLDLRDEGPLDSQREQLCEQLLADVSVELRAADEDAGQITYLFQQNTVLTLDYGNNLDRVVVDLDGLKRFSDARDALDPSQTGETRLPETVQGELTVAASTSSTDPEAEAGEISITVSRRINIAGGDTSASIGTGELFGLSVDAASGEGAINIDVGALSTTGPFADEDTFSLNLEGVTANAQINTNGDNGQELVISNLGLGRGPLIMRVNAVDALRLTMETFGFTVNGDNGEDGSDPESTATITIDNAMDIGLMLNNVLGFDDEASADLTAILMASAPAGTLMRSVEVGEPDFFGDTDSALQVAGGGPFMLNLSSTNGDDTDDQSLTVNAGQCIGGSGGDSSSSELPFEEDDEDEGLGEVFDCP